MLYRAKFAVLSEMNTKLIHTFDGQSLKFLMKKLVVNEITSRI
jgi:hypothetical protein